MHMINKVLVKLLPLLKIMIVLKLASLISKKIMFPFMKMIRLSCLIILKIVFYLRMT